MNANEIRKNVNRVVFLCTKILFLILIITGCEKRNSFQLVLLPDTQVYSERFPEIFKAQTAWIAENADSITFVLHQGDITNRNTEEQWQNAVDAIQLLDDKVPFTFVGGNHDMGDSGRANTRDTEFLNRYLPYKKYSTMESFGGAFESGKMDNTWHTFKAGGLKWLILSLEFGPRDTVLEWAAEVIERHPSHKVIINTHAYMYSDDTNMSAGRDHRWVPQGYGVGKLTGKETANDGEMMWEKLVSQFPNIFMVVSGHVLNDGTGRLIRTGKHGNKVYQVLANYQMDTNGGNGFLRILKINPKEKKITVRSFSPYTGEFKTDPDHQFEFEEVTF